MKPNTKAILARANEVTLPKVRAYNRMELTSPGVRPPLNWARVVATVDVLDAALEALSCRMADTRALYRRVEELEAALRQAEHALTWVDAHWTKSAADRGTGLPMCRAALDAARAALEGTTNG